MCSSSTHIPTGSHRLMSAIFLFAEPFGGKWVGRCRIFFLKTSWEPDLGWIYGLCYRTCAGNVCLSRISASQSLHMWRDLAPLQNGNEPPEHKNYFLSIGTMVRTGVLGLYPCDSFCSGLHPRANLAGRVVAYPRCQPMRAAFAPKSPPSLRVLHLPVCLPKANGPTTSTRVPTHARCVCTQVPTHAT